MAEESSSQPKQSGISQDKQWQCPLCPKGYHNSRNLRRHVVTKHPEEKDLPDVISATKSRDDCREECPHCSASFVELRKHIKICPMDPQRVLKDPQESSGKLPQKRLLDQLSDLECLYSDKAKLQKTVQPSTVEFMEVETPETEATKNDLQGTNAFSPNDYRADMAPGPSSGVRSNSPPPGLVVAAEEEDSISDSQELARAREEADREFAEMLHQREEDKQPVRDAPEVVTVRNMGFWARFDKFLDINFPGQEKEASAAYVRSFCEFAEKVPEDLLMWGDLDVLPRVLCRRADVPFCEKWLDGFEDMKDKHLAAEAYEMLLQFLVTLLPSMDDSDEEDRELIQLRLNVLLALRSRLRALDLNGDRKGKGDKKNKK